MIIRIKTSVMFSNGETYPVDSLERYLGSSFEFDCNEKHYYVRTHHNRQFETLIGTWNGDEGVYTFKKCDDMSVIGIFRTEEYIDDNGEVR